MKGAGRLSERITLQRMTETPDGIGGSTKSWADFSQAPNVWADVVSKAGRESISDDRMNATFTVLFTIYNRSDVTELDRILWNGTPYNIRGIRRNGWTELKLVIEAERGVAQ